MNKAQIKAELRRSACEDESPPFDCNEFAFEFACSMKDGRTEHLTSAKTNDCRTFFLLVAEAM